MAKAPALGMSLSEETLTETALYEIALEHQGAGEIRITIATKPAEKRHGADWTWWLVKGPHCVSLRVQAKRLFPNGTYQSLFKAPPNRHAQLQRLIDAAQREGHVPLCCFFNFHHHSIDIDNSKGRCQHSYHGPSFWGCSLASPEKVIAIDSDRYDDLQSVMYPWHTLVCNYSYPRSLIDAALDFFVSVSGGRVPNQRSIPDNVRRLIESRQLSIGEGFVDERYYADGDDTTAPGDMDDLAGVVVFEDLRT